MLDVFRFAWFAVRTFLGVIGVVLVLYAGLWLFVKILSAAPPNLEPGAALRHMNSYSAQANWAGSKRETVVPAGTADGDSR